MWGRSIKIGARHFWGRDVFVLVISNINIGFQKSLTLFLSILNSAYTQLVFLLSVTAVTSWTGPAEGKVSWTGSAWAKVSWTGPAEAQVSCTGTTLGSALEVQTFVGAQVALTLAGTWVARSLRGARRGA